MIRQDILQKITLVATLFVIIFAILFIGWTVNKSKTDKAPEHNKDEGKPQVSIMYPQGVKTANYTKDVVVLTDCIENKKSSASFTD